MDLTTLLLHQINIKKAVDKKNLAYYICVSFVVNHRGIAQLVRALPLHGRSPRFESVCPYHFPS